MGWNGGGLGRDEGGIVEPIEPQSYYAGSTMGLGQLTEQPVFLDHAYLKTLNVILEFVKNYLEKELRFDTKFTPMERKRIHRTVQEMRDGVDSFPAPYRSVIMEICHHNDYILYTESDGEKKTRHLVLYKEPQEHMYVIYPEDLNNEGNEDHNIAANKAEDILEVEKKINDINLSESCQHIKETEKYEVIEKDNDNLIEETNNVVEDVLIIQDKSIVIDKKNSIKRSHTDNELSYKENNRTKNQIHIEASKTIENSAENKMSDEELKVLLNIENNISQDGGRVQQNNSVVKLCLKNKTKNKEIKQNGPKTDGNKHVFPENNFVNDKTKDVVNNKHKSNKKDVSEILDLIINYFKEFTEDQLVNEFRFLGPFDCKERRAINMFFEVCQGKQVINDRSQEVIDLFDSCNFSLEIRQDNNGRYLIYKIQKESE